MTKFAHNTLPQSKSMNKVQKGVAKPSKPASPIRKVMPLEQQAQRLAFLTECQSKYALMFKDHGFDNPYTVRRGDWKSNAALETLVIKWRKTEKEMDALRRGDHSVSAEILKHNEAIDGEKNPLLVRQRDFVKKHQDEALPRWKKLKLKELDNSNSFLASIKELTAKEKEEKEKEKEEERRRGEANQEAIREAEATQMKGGLEEIIAGKKTQAHSGGGAEEHSANGYNGQGVEREFRRRPQKSAETETETETGGEMEDAPTQDTETNLRMPKQGGG
eukprot:Platyproteum_vivax@DN6169_c0_g1_i1.p1